MIAEEHLKFVACVEVVLLEEALSKVAPDFDCGWTVAEALVVAAAAADSVVSFLPLPSASPEEPMSAAVASLADDYSEMLYYSEQPDLEADEDVAATFAFVRVVALAEVRAQSGHHSVQSS